MSQAKFKPLAPATSDSGALPSGSTSDSGGGRGDAETLLTVPRGGNVSRRGPLVLRVLTGAQKGAEAEMRHQRMLIGNLEAECDVVLDVDRAERHACLIRLSEDGWTVLSIAGDLWAGASRIVPQQTSRIAHGMAMTLGGVSFCVAKRGTDWTRIVIPEGHAVQAASAAAVSKAASSAGATGQPRLAGLESSVLFSRVRGRRTLTSIHPERNERRAGRSKSGGLLAAISLGVTSMAIGGVGIYLAWNGALPSTSNVATTPARTLEAARAVLASLPWASELTLQPDVRSERVVVGGYLPQRDQARLLEQALRQHGIEPEGHWVAVDELLRELQSRLGISDSSAGDRLRHVSSGHFVVTDSSENFQGLDRSVRRAMQAMPSVEAIELRLGHTVASHASDEAHEASPPTVVRYARQADASGSLVVTGLEQFQPSQTAQRYRVNEVRIGILSSVVLDNGARYFQGALLPGGASLLQIERANLLVRVGNDDVRVPLSTDAR